MASLLKEIQDAAVDGSQSISNILRKCALLASELENTELRDWVFSELNGYKTNDIPAYRIIAASLQGSFAGPFNSGYKNVMIAAIALPEGLQERARRVTFTEPIASLEAFATKKSDGAGTLTFNWPGDWIAWAQEHGKFDSDLVLYGAWQTVSTSTVVGIIDSVRNRILEFCLRLAKESPSLLLDPERDGVASPNPDVAAAAGEASKHLFQTIIFGNHTGNIANASPAAVQTTTVTAGDVPELVKALREVGVPATETKALVAAIKADGGDEIGPSTSTWMRNAGAKVAAGAWKVGTGVTTSVITKIVLAHFGIVL